MLFTKKRFRITIFSIAIIGVIVGVVYALDFLGIINFSKMASKVPVVGQYFTNEKSKNEKDKTTKDNEQIKILMDANQKLADSNNELKNKLSEITGKLSKLSAEKKDLENKYNEEVAKSLANNESNEKNIEDEKYRKLAKYYNSMKPEAAVKIMNVLDEYLVIEILSRVDNDQTAKILSKMEPKKAANISKQMTN